MMLNAPKLWLTGIAAIAVLAVGVVSAMIDPAPRTAYAQSACSTEPFFSEYVEGTSNNKAVEIFNGTNAPLDLSAYEVLVYANGSGTPTSTIALSGSLDPGDVYVVAAQDILGVEEDQVIAALNFNGNDAVALAKDGVAVDIIGDIGVDPGAAWVSESGLATLDRTLTRKSTVSAGRTTSVPDFHTTLGLEWDGINVDTFFFLGSHTADCYSAVEPTPTPANTGSVATTINATDAPGPCLLLSTDSIDYGTLAFSTSLTPRSAGGEVDITTCNEEPQDILARGADATGSSATWTLADLPVSGNMCDTVDAENRYAHTLDDGAGSVVSLSNTNQTYQVGLAGATIVGTQTLFAMPCTGSDGAGELMSTSITFTAIAYVP